jgi:hypothetical protein
MKSNGFGIASLILSIANLVAFFFIIRFIFSVAQTGGNNLIYIIPTLGLLALTIIISLLSIGFAVVQKKEKYSNPIATTGLIIGCIPLAAIIIYYTIGMISALINAIIN